MENTGENRLNKYFERVFVKFDSGASKAAWNWSAAIFQFIWYMFKGMWPKVFLYAVVFWLLAKLPWIFLIRSISILNIALILIFSSGLHIWLAAFIYFGLMANYDYYLYRRKGELLWPKLPYRKLKVPFWLAVCAVILYAAYSALCDYGAKEEIETYKSEARPRILKSFETSRAVFTAVPDQWLVYVDPPKGFSLDISRTAGDNPEETLTLVTYPGTKFIGYVVEENGKEKIEKGLVALAEIEPGPGETFDSARDEIMMKKVRALMGLEKETSVKILNGTITAKFEDAEYREFSGQKWGSVKITLEASFGGEKNTSNITIYWTAAGGKAVYLTYEALTPYRDEVAGQVESFLSSFKPR